VKSARDWEDQAKSLLKAELKRRNVTYAQLVGKLADIGVMDSEPNIRNKLARGKFTAVFLLQCLEAIGASSLRLSDG
jgi:microsomal dipeptidase-like Zn-dependent dipeptidase